MWLGLPFFAIGNCGGVSAEEEDVNEASQEAQDNRSLINKRDKSKLWFSGRITGVFV